LFGLLLACSFGFPFSKTLSLIAAGVLVSRGVGQLPAFMLVGVAGLVASDGIYYGLGYWGGERVLRWRFFSRHVSLEALREAELRYHRQGWWAVFAARFTPFVRVVIFLVAGLSRMSPRRFFLADALSAVLYVLPLCLAGYHFSENRRRIYQAVRESEALLAGLVLLGTVGLAGWVWWKRRPGRRGAPESRKGPDPGEV